MDKREQILKANRDVREGRAQQPTRLEDGYASFRIPTEDYKVLSVLFPDLNSKDHDIRLAAWHKLRKSPIGEQYLVTRTPRQVQANSNRIIVK